MSGSGCKNAASSSAAAAAAPLSKLQGFLHHRDSGEAYDIPGAPGWAAQTVCHSGRQVLAGSTHLLATRAPSSLDILVLAL
jgi:hypothetical protein